MSELPVRSMERGDAVIAYRRAGQGPALVLLHATLSSSAQLLPLVNRLAASFTVLAVDRRGSGETRLPPAPPAPIDVAVHVADLAALLAAEGIGPILAVGHSYGGCLALEFAARRPELVGGAWVFEPPYALVASAAIRRDMARLRRLTVEAGRRSGPPAAAEAFLAAVAGPKALAALSPSARQRIRAAGGGALSDVTLVGLNPAGLAGIRCPVVVATGTASRPFYAEIAAELVKRIGARALEPLAGVDHGAPITNPGLVATAIEEFAASIGWAGRPELA